MALNALSTTTVGYQNKGTTVTTGDGTTVEIGNTAASVDYGSGLLYKTAYDKVVDKWGHDLVGSNASGATNEGEVFEVANTTDSFERPAREYKVNGETYIFAKEADLTYTAEVKLGDIYKDLGLSKNISDNSKITFHVDGAAETASGNSNNGTALSTLTLVKGDNTNKIGGNGVLTQVYYNKTAETAVITMVNTYIGDVVSVTNATSNADRYVTIAGRSATAGTYETETLAKEDVVLYTYSKKTSDTGVKSAVVAEKVTGQLTGYSAGKTLVVDGTTYSYSAKAANTADSSSLKIDVDVYLDSYGYAIDVEGVKTDAEYAFVLKHNSQGGTYGNDEIAQLLLADGTIVDVTVKTNNGSAGAEDMVSYTVDSNGKYTITKVMDLTAVGAGDALSITKGSSSVVLDDDAANTPSHGNKVQVTATGKTVFLVTTGTATEPVYTAYTGIANVPSIALTGSTTAVYAYAVKSGVAQVIYVDARGAVVNADATDIVYIAGDANSAKVTDADGDYYVYKAVVDGEITTLKVDATLAANQGLTSGTNTVYKSVNYNTKGIVVSVGTAGISGTGTDKESNGTIGLNGAYYAYTSDCQVFYVDKDENISVSSIGAIIKDSTDTVKFVTNSDGKVVAIFVEEQISALSAIQATGHTVYVNGVAATLTSESATGATITSAVKAGDVITIAPAISSMATASSSLSGNGTATGTKTAGLAGYTVVAGDTGSVTVEFNVVVVSESGVAAAPAQFTVTLPASLS